MSSKLFKNTLFIFFVVIVGSILGFIHENIMINFYGPYSLRQGLLYEPMIPVYGIGALVLYFGYHYIPIPNKHKILECLIAFAIGFVIGTIVEFSCSYLQEKIIGTISWDYTRYRFNLNGRISLFHSTFWGLCGLAFYLFIMPLIEKSKKILDHNWGKAVLSILTLIFILDCSISFIACQRREERRDGIEASSKLDTFLDEHYSDSVIDRVYNNARRPKR